MYVTDHAKQRMWQRFNVAPSKIHRMVNNASVSFWVIDRQSSYEASSELSRKKIVYVQSIRAYCVIDMQDHVLTVLTEDMAMANIKVGKWVKL